MVNVTIKAAMRHGDLHLASKKLGGVKALAEHLGVSVHAVGGWYRYEACPPAQERLPYWPQAKIDELEKKLFALTGKLLDDLFPEAVRDKEFLRLEKAIETTKDIELSLLISMAKQVRGLEYREPDAVEQKELTDAVRASLGTLCHREREVVKMRYGLGCESMTLDEVAFVFKVTRERIRQIEGKAIRKLRYDPNVSKGLVGHLAE